MISFSNPFAWNPRPVATLHGRSAATLAICFSPNGKYVACGGTEGLQIWETSSWKVIPVSSQSYVQRVQISCITWLTKRNEPVDTLCYGNINGYLVVLQFSSTEVSMEVDFTDVPVLLKRYIKSHFEVVASSRSQQGQEIISLSSRVYGADIPRIAICTRYKCIQVFTFDTGTHKLSPFFSRMYAEGTTVTPRTVIFDNNLDNDLFVFGMYDGILYKHSGKDTGTTDEFKLISQHQLSLQIGNAAVDTERRLCVVDNVGDGFNVYKLDLGLFLKTLTTRDSIKTYPKGVAFAAQLFFVVGGSDHGLVYIFDRKTGEVVTTLHYSHTGGTETIAAYDGNDGSVFIAAASSTSTSTGPIKIWKWFPPNARQAIVGTTSLKRVLFFTFKAIIVIAAIAYVYEQAQHQYNLHRKTTAGSAGSSWSEWRKALTFGRWAEL